MEAVKAGTLTLDEKATAHLDGCLGCFACETACPSGVSFGIRMEEFLPRLAGGSATAWQRFSRRVATSDRLLDTGLRAARAIDTAGLGRLRRRVPGLGILPGRDRSLEGRELAPLERSHVHQPVYPRARVALLTGCVADRIAPTVNRDAIEVLQTNDVEVVEVPEQVCCGALAFHRGDTGEALSLARENVAVFSSLLAGRVDYVVTTAAGCGAMLRDYGRLLAADTDGGAAELVSRQVRDVCELLVELDFRRPELPAEGRRPVAYHDACHLLHACGIEDAPRAVCAAATGASPVDLGENAVCCGSAGSYNLEHPDIADELGRRKAELVAATGLETVAVANVGCQLQMARALALARVKAVVRHPVELLAEAYRSAASR